MNPKHVGEEQMAVFQLRKHKRFNAVVPVRYGYAGTPCEGLLKDLSVGGGSITGMVPVSVGMELTVQLSVPGNSEPLLISRALVKWVKGLEFGVEFELLPADTKVHGLIATLVHDRCATRRFVWS